MPPILCVKPIQAETINATVVIYLLGLAQIYSQRDSCRKFSLENIVKAYRGVIGLPLRRTGAE
ncbi:MAG: hypothetical protein HKO91_05125 [Desulfobacterales bacterium]|nr:hypothetical protein [Desulfobacterales bacterium]